ncbi:hypothetical protein SCLCIDRAFT_1182339, partial [Scleroderma citrinum Foug A]
MCASKNDSEHGCNFMLYTTSCKNIGFPRLRANGKWVVVHRIVRMGTVEVMAFEYAFLGNGNRREDAGEAMLIDVAQVRPRASLPRLHQSCGHPSIYITCRGSRRW